MNKKRVMSLEEKLPSVPEAIFLFRSCTGTLQYPGVENAIKYICGMGIETIMDPTRLLFRLFADLFSVFAGVFPCCHGTQPRPGRKKKP